MAASWTGALGLGESTRRLAQRIEVASDGGIAIEVRATDRSGIDAVATDEADLYHASENANLHHDPAFAHFAGLPVFTGLEPLDLDAWVSVAGGQAAWDRLAGAFGVKALLAGHTGRAPGMWSRAPISGLTDLRRGPVATTGLAARVLDALGGRALTLNEGDLRSALEGGRVAAVEHAGFACMARLGLPTIGPCHTAFGFSTSGTALSLGIRRSVWEALTAAERAIIEACCTEEFHRSLALARTSEATARAALAAAGTTFDSLPSGVLSGFAAAADEVVATLGRGGREARKIHANYMEFKRGLSPGPLTARPAGATDNAVMARNRALTM